MTSFEIGTVISWMVGVIVISLLLLVLVYVWKHLGSVVWKTTEPGKREQQTP